MESYVHIGLGKCGSTFLQQILFREICKKLNLDLYVNDFKDLKEKKNFLISQENLVGEFFNFKTCEEAANENLKIFGKQTTIIIVIRRAIDYFSSYFAQCYHAYKIISEKEFFKTEDEIKKNLTKDEYFARYEKFDYQKLIELYTNKFDNVYVVKYEDLKDLKIWSKIFNNKSIIDTKFTDVYFNRSYSLSAMKLTYLFEKLLSIFGTNLFNIQNKVRQIPQTKFLPIKIKNRLAYELRWRFFIQNRFDKFFPYKKYEIRNKKIKNFLKNKHDKFYDNYYSSFYHKNEQFRL